MEGVPLAEAPMDRVVDGVAVAVLERLSVVDPLSLPDGVCVGVHEFDGVSVQVGEVDPDGVEDSVVVVEPVPESDPVFEELAPVVSDAVGDPDEDGERLNVELGVADDVAVLERVGESMGKELTRPDAPAVETLGIMLTLAPETNDCAAVSEIVDVGVAEAVIEKLFVVDAESLPDGVCVGLDVAVPVSEELAPSAETDASGDGVSGLLTLAITLASPVCECEAKIDAIGESD